ncbi:MAG TPA: hypothetical protein DDY98_08775 [Ruminococcaceae bacterium]|nr:hypothetical protein [Oscillospiraceae bacterium]
MLSVSENLLAELEQNSIRYLHWKGNCHYADGFNGKGDIDMLVHRDDREKVHTLLRSLHFINPKTQSYFQNNNIEDWLGFDEKYGVMTHLHLYFEIQFGSNFLNEYTFLPYEQCFEEATVLDNCRVQNPAIEYVLLLCRVAVRSIEKEKKIEGNRLFLIHRMEEDSFTQTLKKCGLTQEECSRLFDTTHDAKCETKDVADILKKLYRKNTSFAKLKIINRKLSYQIRKRKSIDSVGFFTKKRLRNGGCMIAFVGQDGAGKTRVASDIAGWLRKKLEVRRFYLGSGENYYSFQRDLLKVLPKGKAFKLIRGVLALSDQLHIAKRCVSTLKKAQIYAVQGGIALFDRYPQTQFPGINDGAKIREIFLPKATNPLIRKITLIYAKREEKLLKKAVRIQPDLVIKLMLTTEESLRRKPKENAENVQRKHEIIKQLAFPKSRVVVVDVMKEYHVEITEIKSIIWRKIR